MLAVLEFLKLATEPLVLVGVLVAPAKILIVASSGFLSGIVFSGCVHELSPNMPTLRPVVVLVEPIAKPFLQLGHTIAGYLVSNSAGHSQSDNPMEGTLYPPVRLLQRRPRINIIPVQLPRVLLMEFELGVDADADEQLVGTVGMIIGDQFSHATVSRYTVQIANNDPRLIYVNIQTMDCHGALVRTGMYSLFNTGEELEGGVTVTGFDLWTYSI